MSWGGTITAMVRERPWIRQVAAFSTSGLIAAAIDFGGLTLLIHLGVSPYVGRLATVAVATVFTWYFNRTLTFATSGPPSLREFLHYAGAAGASIALNLAIYWTALYLGAAPWLALVTGTGFAAIFSFFRYRAILDKSEA